MAKTYFNSAIVGNSSMLGCLGDKGELVRLFWPNIDYPQHMDNFFTGIYFTEFENSTLWMDRDIFKHSQRYICDTNIVETIFEARDRGIKITQTDFVLPESDILVRSYNIENICNNELNLGFAAYSGIITTNPALAGTLFDFDTDALIHYRHNYYISICADREACQFQLGNNAFDAASSTVLNGFDSIGMMPDGSVLWKLGSFLPGEKKTFNLYLSAAHTLKDVKNAAKKSKQLDSDIELKKTIDYWHAFLKKSVVINTGRSDLDDLYRRSLLVFKLMSDKKTGGLLAAPEIDEEFTKCGRYAYCWGRDAAFITEAMDKSGLHESVDKFYRWAASVQNDDGSWEQRYHMDGNLGPSWGLQIDETGTLVWGILRHYKNTGDRSFLSEMWETAAKAVNFMTDFIDEETGLPLQSFDLWEERFGEHFYSSAAVLAGIKAGVEIAGILGKDIDYIGKWIATAENIEAAIIKYFWKDNEKRFIRSIRVKLNPWGRENSDNTTFVKVNPKGYKRDVTLEDWLVDISLLGISVPFDILHTDDYRVKSTVELVEKVLSNPGIGGLKRYEYDNYIGGNPWILTTLWAALYHAENGNVQKAFEYLDWAVKGCTDIGLLPEQVGKDDGKPQWVIPLTWSHAMFVLVLFKLFGK